jgi:hypothetical protein
MSAPESAGDRAVAEPAIPDPGTLDVDDVTASHWTLESLLVSRPMYHRKKHPVPGDGIMSKRKSREVVDGDLQGPLSWDATYDQFLRLPLSWPSGRSFLPPRVSANEAHTSLGWPLIFFVIALVVFVSALVRYFRNHVHIFYFHNHVHFIRSHILPAFSNAWLTVFPREIAVPVAHLVLAKATCVNS